LALVFRKIRFILKGLHHQQKATEDDLQSDIVLYAGENIVPFGETLLAVPLSALWQ